MTANKSETKQAAMQKVKQTKKTKIDATLTFLESTPENHISARREMVNAINAYNAAMREYRAILKEVEKA